MSEIKNDQRKDAGVVDRDGLENRCTRKGTEGSNPSLSAKRLAYASLFLLFICDNIFIL